MDVDRYTCADTDAQTPSHVCTPCRGKRNRAKLPHASCIHVRTPTCSSFLAKFALSNTPGCVIAAMRNNTWADQIPPPMLARRDCLSIFCSLSPYRDGYLKQCICLSCLTVYTQVPIMLCADVNIPRHVIPLFHASILLPETPERSAEDQGGKDEEKKMQMERLEMHCSYPLVLAWIHQPLVNGTGRFQAHSKAHRQQSSKA